MSSGVSPAYIKTAEDRILVLDRLEQTVGREEGADLIIADKSISRVHAVLRYDSGTWTLEDLESRNKTFINEKAIQPRTPTPLTDGCTVHFGYVKVSFHMGMPNDMAVDVGATVAINMDDLRKAQQAAAAPAPAAKPTRAPEPPPPAMTAGGTMVMKPIKRGEAAAVPPDALGYLELASVDKMIRLYIRTPVAKLGTDPRECDLLINEREADGEHAEVRYNRDKTITIKNLSSTYGTWVDGRRVAKANLVEGTMVKIGDSTYIYHHIKNPILEEDKNAATRAAVRFLIVAVLVLMAAAGGYFVWLNSQRKPQTNALGSAEVAVRQEILDLVNIGKYAQAATRIQEITDSSTIDEATKSMAAELRGDVVLLRDARDAISKKNIGSAYETVLKVSTSGPVAEQAKVDIADIKEKYVQYLQDVGERVVEMEKKGEFDILLTTTLPALRAADKTNEGKWVATESRVRLKKKLLEVYRSGVGEVKNDYEAVREKVVKATEEANAAMASDSSLSAELTPFLDKLKDLELDADFMKAYLTFDGSVGTEYIKSVVNSIGKDYDAGRRAIMDQNIATLDRAMVLKAEFEAVLPTIQGMRPDVSLVQKLDALLANRNEVQQLERDPRFTLKAIAERDIEAVEDAKKKQIVDVWTLTAPPIDRNTYAGKIEFALEQRERAFLVLSMFPREARLDRDDMNIVQNWVRDPDLAKIFQDANRMYNTARTDVTQFVLETYKTTKEEYVIMNTDKYLDRLAAGTIPEDSETADKIEALRNRLRTEFK